MRVGELLIQRGWIDGASVQRAVAEQTHAGKRLCSLLIARGLLDPDLAARALAEQHHVAAVLQKHLEHRDRSLAGLLPGLIARNSCALPIGRLQSGELIVCMRDPRRELIMSITLAVHERIIVAVAPASQLEQLVEKTYPPSAGDEFEVDLSTGPIPTIDVDMNSGPIALPDFSALSLVGLDDHRVAKDHSHAPRPATPSLPPANKPQAQPPRMISARTNPMLVKPATLAETIAALDQATTRDDATDAAMRFAAGRWHAALMMTIKDGAGLGYRGKGEQLGPDIIQALAIPLTTPSLVKLACDKRALVSDPPAGGAIQERLERLLGNPRFPIAAPVLVGARVACVLVCGDTISGDEGGPDLDRLTNALGTAYERIVRESKR